MSCIYMIENRSFDHVCGWLYEKGEESINFVGRDGPFNGAKYDMYNVDPDVDPAGTPRRCAPKRCTYTNIGRRAQRGLHVALPARRDRPVSRPHRRDASVLFDGINYDSNGYANRTRPPWAGSYGTRAFTR